MRAPHDGGSEEQEMKYLASDFDDDYFPSWIPVEDRQEYLDCRGDEDIARDEFLRLSKQAIRSAEAIWHWGDGNGGELISQFESLVREIIPQHQYQSPKNKKKKISQSIRRKVFERDKYRCVRCGTHLDLSVDHIIPESKGGAHDLSNFQTLCRSCNSKKGVN